MNQSESEKRWESATRAAWGYWFINEVFPTLAMAMNESDFSGLEKGGVAGKIERTYPLSPRTMTLSKVRLRNDIALLTVGAQRTRWFGLVSSLLYLLGDFRIGFDGQLRAQKGKREAIFYRFLHCSFLYSTDFA